jgi:hypothetical protein
MDKVWGKLQILALGPFDHGNISWKMQYNSGHNGQVKEVMKAVIKWSRFKILLKSSLTLVTFHVCLSKSGRKFLWIQRKLSGKRTYT